MSETVFEKEPYENREADPKNRPGLVWSSVLQRQHLSWFEYMKHIVPFQGKKRCFWVHNGYPFCVQGFSLKNGEYDPDALGHASEFQQNTKDKNCTHEFFLPYNILLH